MSTRTKWLSLSLTLLFQLVFIGTYAAGTGVELYTPYTRISVPPGETINYNIEVINNTSQIQTMPISVVGMPRGWDSQLKSGGWKISQISVLPGKKEKLSLKVDVPLKINKGSYHFKVLAGGYTSLLLNVVVSKRGTYQTEFTTDQPNMKGNSKASFTFKAKLKNSTDNNQLYALKADAPRGWNVTIKASYKEVASVNIAPNAEKDISIQIKPPSEVKAGTYRIPVTASSGTTSAEIALEVVITGTFNMDLTTPTGLLSTDITAGDQKQVEFLVRNTGSSDLKDINFDVTKPTDWKVTFDPKKIIDLQAGKTTKVMATIQASKKAIAGDYVTKIEAKTPEIGTKAELRVTVKTPMLWGWIGVFIILLALGSVFYLFRKYGRR
ncbi:NEW3 domain-containing protein [Prolixibacter sp. NT017]|uniref:COG1470 family protein n=1 Tax=Prolixibacter sp. NT017 TaxID=2652390 RepID=UPI001280913B|nr:NEW3 domain-containing protein [Prolixibacter sp. NT017]GET27022.1 hypothetical protein NT017_33510 [Prolixibacter sp. NT017]